MPPKPPVTATVHTLPFARLAWDDFERMGMALLINYEGVQHYGAAGGEEGRDIVATKNGDLWYVQCKRLKKCGAERLLNEIEQLTSKR